MKNIKKSRFTHLGLWFTAFAVYVLASGFPVPAQAVLINGGFETGDFTGWNLVTPPGATSTVLTTTTVFNSAGGSATQTPYEGSYFAQLKTDGPGSINSISQTVTGSGSFTGAVSLFDSEYPVFGAGLNDTFKVEIFDGGGGLVATPFSLQHADNLAGPSFYDWQPWSVDLGSGTYTVQYSIYNGGDSAVDSYLFADAVQQVPEPATLLLLGSGLIGMAALRKKFRA